MNKTTTPARLVVTRTPEINELLKEAWMLSPELKEKISLTIHQAIVALVQERRRYKAFASESFSPRSVNVAETSIEEAVEGVNNSITEDFTTEDSKTIPRENESHPDSIWND